MSNKWFGLFHNKLHGRPASLLARNVGYKHLRKIKMNYLAANFRKFVRLISGASISSTSSASTSQVSSLSSTLPLAASSPLSPASSAHHNQSDRSSCARVTPDLIEYPLRSPSLHSVDSPRLITFDEQYIDLTPSRPLACPVEDASLPDELADEFLASYVNWPSDAQKSPIELANAGFIYTGDQDVVQCHRCHGTLAEWQSLDNVWVEHARFYPNCPFVRSVKGMDFVDQSRQTKPEPQSPSAEPPSPQLITQKFECKVCLNKEISVAFVPCGHSTCGTCSVRLDNCPLCREKINTKLDLFFC